MSKVIWGDGLKWVTVALLFLFVTRPFYRSFAQETTNFCSFATVVEDSSVGNRPTLSGTERTSETNHFRIHYTLDGSDATTTRWVDSIAVAAEWSFSRMEAFTWALPPGDSTHGGNSKYDIYVRDQAAIGAWGLTVPDFPVGSYAHSYCSWIEVHRDSIGRPYPKWMQLRAVVAHEFTHACQISYRLPNRSEGNSEMWFAENTAAYMERVVNPNDSSFLFRFSGIDNPLKKPELPLNWTVGDASGYQYAGLLWPRFLDERYGAGTVRAIWNQIAMAEGTFNTFSETNQRLLESNETTLNAALQEYAIWRYFTGSRADTYHFSIAPLLPAPAIKSTVANYPATGEAFPRTLLTSGGAQLVEFLPGTGNLLVVFDGQDGYAMSASLVAVKSSGQPTVTGISLNGQNFGTASLSWQDVTKYVLVPVVTELPFTPAEVNYTYRTDVPTNPVTISFTNSAHGQDIGSSIVVDAQDSVASGRTRQYQSGSAHEARAFERISSDSLYKHKLWNYSESSFPLGRSFTAVIGSDQAAQFSSMRSVTVCNQLIDGTAFTSTTDSIRFKDPWYLKLNGTQPDAFLTFAGPYSPKGAEGQTEGGAFLTQNPYYIPTNPSYWGSAESVKRATVGGGSTPCYFLGWGGTNVSYQDAADTTTRIVFTAANATAKARYKAHLGSSLASATGSNGQRKMVYIGLRYHLVYESAGDIWYVNSTDNGTTWSKETCISDGLGKSRQPSLAANQTFVTGDPYRIACAWEYVDGPHASLQVRRSDGMGTWSPSEEINSILAATTEGATPVITLEHWCETIAWKGDDGYDGIPALYLYVRSDSGLVISNDPIPGTGANSVHPTSATVAYGQSEGEFAVAWSNASRIYYKRYHYNRVTRTLTCDATEEVTTGVSSDYTSHDYPTISFEATTTPRPVIAWSATYQMTEQQVVLERRRESTGWSGTLLTQYSINGEDALRPSIGRLAGSSNLNLSFHGSNDLIYLSKYRSGAWGSKTALTGVQGAHATLGFGDDGSTTNFRIAYTGLSSIYRISTSGEGLAKTDGEPPESVERKVVYGGTTSRGKTFDVTVGLAQSDILGRTGIRSPLPFKPFDDSHTLLRENAGSEFLSTAPLSYDPGTSIALTVSRSIGFRSGLENEGDPSDKLTLFTTVREVQSGRIVAKVAIDTIALIHGNTSTAYTLNCDQIQGLMAGTQVTIGLTAEILGGGTLSAICTPMDIRDTPTGSVLKPPVRAGEKILSLGSDLPKSYGLSEGYPNPFNPSTTIRYALVSEGMVSLRVYDMLGREVATLVDGSHKAGYYERTWKATGVASGVYYARLTVADELGNVTFTKVSKLLLMK